MKQNYFEFNNNIYTTDVGLAMGNPISPLASEFFMDNLEAKIRIHPLFKKFIFWKRYVDGILALFTGTTRQLDIFFNFINSIHKNISFTRELEIDNKINFLDLTISKTDNKFTFKIFHKPTQTDMITHNSSAHPRSHKHAAFHSYIHRLTTVPLEKAEFMNELNFIKQVAFNNGYSPKIIDSLVKKKLLKKAINIVFPPPVKPKFLGSITYIGKISSFIKYHPVLKNHPIAFKTNHNLGRYIKNNKSKTAKLEKSGVYRLNCGTCDKVYIGQTGRSFKHRISEHNYNYRYNKESSNYAKHLNEFSHNFDNNFEVLHSLQKGPRLDMYEALEINRLKRDNILLNDQCDLKSSPLLNLFES